MGEFSGYDVAAAVGAAVDSAQLERKTVVAAYDTNKQSVQEVVVAAERNVLNGYRSVTYNFTLAALKKDYLKNPNKLRESELELVIIKSGGKGITDIKRSADSFIGSVTTSKAGAGRGAGYVDRNYGNETLDNILEGFNNSSPGRFDMFIENVEIDSSMAFSLNSSLSMPTRIKFDVIEPFSVNGFMEALHVTAVAAGYPNYQQASFVLKMEFWGYSDDSMELLDPEKIDSATRYFPIGFTGVDVSINERGTRYICSAVPYNERAFGEPNLLKTSIKMAGSSVKEVLTNLMNNVNSQLSKADKDGKATYVNSNKYSITFKKWSDTLGWIDDPDGKIAKSPLQELMKGNSLYKMDDPANSTQPNAYKKDGTVQPSVEQQANSPESIKYIPNKSVVQFAENTNIHEIISAVIRDSDYSRRILKNISGSVDQYGMIEYFMIKIEVLNLDTIDEVSKKPFQNFNYVVLPHKIHYTKLPNYGSDLVKEETLKKISRREYNFIYTGQNLDVINFKLNFNSLFFEAVPVSMGNKDTPSSKTGASPSGDSDIKVNGTSIDTLRKNEVPLNATKVDALYTKVHSSGINAGQPLDDPYSVLAKTMHNAIVNSNVSMVTGELEILGDPFYLVTGGMGNYNPAPAGGSNLKDGSANHHYGQLLIVINFRNPVDINSFEDGGMMNFDAKRVPFSGVYQVLSAVSTFKEGKFKQKLNVIRMSGQILDQKLKPSDPADRIKRTPSPDEQIVPTTSKELVPSQRLPNPSDASSNARLSISGLAGAAKALVTSPELINAAVNVATGSLSQ